MGTTERVTVTIDKSVLDAFVRAQDAYRDAAKNQRRATICSLAYCTASRSFDLANAVRHASEG